MLRLRPLLWLIACLLFAKPALAIPADANEGWFARADAGGQATFDLISQPELSAAFHPVDSKSIRTGVAAAPSGFAGNLTMPASCSIC